MPIYTRIKEWHDNYAASSPDDKRALENFIECETREVVSCLRNELIQLVNKNFNPEAMQVLLGPARLYKYGSYDAWAKVMLQWLAGYNK